MVVGTGVDKYCNMFHRPPMVLGESFILVDTLISILTCIKS